jgi:hypothetical protein
MAELSRGQILKNPEVLGSGTEGAKIRFLDGDESNHIDVKIPDSISTNYTFTLPPDDGSVNQVLQTDGDGNTTWTTITAEPGGLDTYIQFNDDGILGGDVDLTWNKTTNLLDINGNIQLKAAGEIRFADSDSSNYVAFKSPGTVAANRIYTLPSIIGTVGQVLKISEGASSTEAILEWANDNIGETNNPGGSDTFVQFNDGGLFGGDAGLTYNKTTDVLSVTGGVDVATGGNYRINNTSVLTSTTLGSGVVNSSLTSVGTLGVLQVDNINLDGNTIISTNTNGDINLDPNGTGTIRFLGNAPLRLFDADNSNYAGLAVVASVTSNYTITLPAAGGAANDILQFDGSQNASFVNNTRSLNFVIDGGGSVITTGVKGHIVLDGNYNVTGWTIIADRSGSIVVDVRRATYTNFPTTTSISGTENPTISSGQKNEDLTLTSWTTTLSARDVLEFVVDSAATVERVTVALRLVPR